jgi:hypothetical protein
MMPAASTAAAETIHTPTLRGVCVPASVDDNVVLRFEFEMRNVEFANRVQGGGDGAGAFGAVARRAQFALDLAERAQDARTVEALSFTMFAEAHERSLPVARGDDHHRLDTAQLRVGQ